MAMGKVPGQDPDAYVQDEVIEWGHLADPSNGPVLVIRAEESRVLSGFRRGQRLRTIEPRLKPGGSMKWRRSTCAKARDRYAGRASSRALGRRMNAGDA